MVGRMRWPAAWQILSVVSLAVLMAATAGCASARVAAPRAASPTPNAASLPVIEPASAAAPAKPLRAPSERLTRYWHLGPRPALAAYVDFEELREAFGSLLGPALLSRFQNKLDAGQQGCLRAFGERAQRSLLVAGESLTLAIIELRDAAARRELESACVGTLLERETTSFAGASKLHAFDHWHVAFEPGRGAAGQSVARRRGRLRSGSARPRIIRRRPPRVTAASRPSA
jgi:hypothetical protein